MTETWRVAGMDFDCMHMGADPRDPPFQNPFQYVIHCQGNWTPRSGPLSPEVSRLGQRIMDAAVASARKGRTVAVPE